jgi:hypothetical protein
MNQKTPEPPITTPDDLAAAIAAKLMERTHATSGRAIFVDTVVIKGIVLAAFARYQYQPASVPGDLFERLFERPAYHSSSCLCDGDEAGPMPWNDADAGLCNCGLTELVRDIRAFKAIA